MYCVPCLLSDYDWQGWVKVRLSRQWKEQPRQRWGRRQRDRGARGEDGQATLRRHLPLQQALWHRHTSSKAEVKGENLKYYEVFQGEGHKGFRARQNNNCFSIQTFSSNLCIEQFSLLEQPLKNSLMWNVCFKKELTEMVKLAYMVFYTRLRLIPSLSIF